MPLVVEKPCDEYGSRNECIPPPKNVDVDKVGGVGSLWNDVVARLEHSVQAGLNSDVSTEVLKSIRLLRQFAVGSTMNKRVIGNSSVLKPRLLDLLGRIRWWSAKDSDICIELCGLVNSLVRDCSILSESILARSTIMDQIVEVILNPNTEATLQEVCLLLLRTLYGAEELSSVLSQTVPVRSRQAAALQLFTEANLRKLIAACGTGLNSSDSPASTPWLTGKSRCYLMQLLSLLATDYQLAVFLRRCGAIQLSHHIVLTAVCDHPKACTMRILADGNSSPVNRVACVRAIDPANQMAARFALKLLVHLFFHVPDSLQAFKEAQSEDHSPFKLLCCYSQLSGSVPPNVPGVSHQVPSGHRTKRMRKVWTTTDDQKLPSSLFCPISNNQNSSIGSQHVRIPVSSCAPSAHGTQVFLGLLRGLIYWRLLNQASCQSIEALDQFGNPVSSSSGLGLSDDDVALMVIQPLTDACLRTDDIRILSWICHVLVLVLGKRPELHQWTVYANSFIREVDVRVTSLIKAVQESSHSHSHVQFVEHLIPLVKLFACLASSCENIRVLFGEVSMCEKLIEFALNLKPMGSEHTKLMLEFQQSIAILLHVLSRSFSAQHSFFRHENVINHLIQLVENNLLEACRGRSLCASVVEAASSTLVNILLPMSPGKQVSQSTTDRCISLFIQLINTTEQPGTSASSPGSDRVNCSLPELTADLRSSGVLLPGRLQATLMSFRLNGIWGLANLLHDAPSALCSELFERLVADGAWLELVRPIQTDTVLNQQTTRSVHPRSTEAEPVRRVSCDLGTIPDETRSDHPEQTASHSPALRSIPFSDPSFLSNKHECSTASFTNDQPGKSFANPNTSADLSSETVAHSCPSMIESMNTKEDSEASLQTLLVFYTLMLLRNLLRHRNVIDVIIKEHWWNITHLIISVLESNHPRPVKEQGIMVLAHIANGQTALEQLHRNEDLVEKLKLFMRSPDSYIKAAALTATFNLLGLGREGANQPWFLGNLREPGTSFFLSSHRGLLHRHHRHKDHHRRRPASHSSTTATASSPESTIRTVVSCVAQSTLEEAEEELEEEEEQDIVLEHANITQTVSDQTLLHRDSDLSRPPERLDTRPQSGWVLQDSTVSCTPVSDAPPESPTSGRRHRRVYRCWVNSPSPSAADFSSQIEIIQSQPPITRSPSGSSSTSSTSTTSCTEELLHSGSQFADLDPTTAQDLCGASSSCSEGELKIMDPCDRDQDSNVMSTHLGETRAPLAAQEGLDEMDTQTSHLSSTTADDPFESTFDSLRDTSVSVNSYDTSVSIPGTSGTSGTSPVSTKHQSSFGPVRSSNRLSRKDWEAGFRHVLLPFLQELESDPILGGTWDWLMLRASTLGRPIPLHQLLVAWQRLHDTIPSSRLSNAAPPPSDIDTSLFANCVTVDAFLKRLKQSLTDSVSPNFQSSPKHREGRHHQRRRHHHCHRHQHRNHSRRTVARSTESPVSEDACISTPVPQTTASEDFERTDDASAS